MEAGRVRKMRPNSSFLLSLARRNSVLIHTAETGTAVPLNSQEEIRFTTPQNSFRESPLDGRMLCLTSGTGASHPDLSGDRREYCPAGYCSLYEVDQPSNIFEYTVFF
jgi:hypothetical protein